MREPNTRTSSSGEMKSKAICSKEDYAMRWKSMLRTALVVLGMLGTANVLWSQNSQIVAVRAGRLFDSKSGQVMTKQVVLIQGERITDVGPEDQIKIPQGARVIDLSQATVLPGLIDGHSHIFDSLSNGQPVTPPNQAWNSSRTKEA